jgi:hypothetical protein
MGQPGLPGSQFPSEDALMRRIKDLERDVQQLRSANQLATAGIRAIDGGIVVDGSMDVQGAETVSGTLAVTGNADFTGNVRIGGTLELPNGIIGNDALADPLVPFAFHADAQNFALGNGDNLPIVSVTVTVPAGFTRAVVNATANLSAANSTGATDTLYCGLKVNGSGPGYSGRAGVPPGVAANPSKTAGVLLTSLGSSFIIEGTASTAVAPWPANVNNNVNLDGTVIFLR